jgi:hypothetical protein
MSMKKTLVILAAMVLASTFSFAQSKGNMFIGGTIGFNNVGGSQKVTAANTSVQTDYQSTTDFNIMGSFHYMITDNLAIGLGLGYSMDKTPITLLSDNGNVTNSMFNIAPSLIYFQHIGDNFAWDPELQIGIGFGSHKDKTQNTVAGETSTVTTTTDRFGFGVAIKPLSFQYSINKHLAINASFGSIYYKMYKLGDSDNYNKTNTFGLGLNAGADFTLRYFF